MKNQNGAALFMTMLMLMVLSFIGAVVLNGASMDLRMTAASGSHLAANYQAEGDVNSIINDGDLTSTITSLDEGEVIDTDSLLTDSDGELTLVSDVTCQRSYDASSTNAISSCRYARITLNQTYGKADAATTTVSVGIEQPLLGQSN